MNKLSFETLHEGVIARLPEFKNKYDELAHSKPDGSDWSPAQWLQAVVGELGEYANIRKKFERGDLSKVEFLNAAADELADVITYLDILAFQLDIDLGAAVMDKFNRVSARIGSSVRITENGVLRKKETDLSEYFILIAPLSVSVKEGNFFRYQGGTNEPWGLRWKCVRAQSIEHARSIGENMRREGVC